MPITLTNDQARRYILRKHGLLGPHKFQGKDGALAFVRQSGCIQFDPIDICGRNADLVLQSRIKNYKKSMLDELLYTDRLLFDYPDKCLSIIPTECWPYYERFRQISRNNALKYPQMQDLIGQVTRHLAENGPISSNELTLSGSLHWRSAIHWSGGTNLTRSVLEQMYSTGDVIIHHKKGTRKYYDLAGRHLAPDLLQTKEPLPDNFAHQKWRIVRRIGAVGLLWNRPSDAWLMINGLTAAIRNEIFAELLAENKITEIHVDGIKQALYLCTDDLPLLDEVLTGDAFKPRCELIAPLDNLIWDRKLLKALFGFDYTWEIYTPADKRQYGYYVLPLLYGDRLIGRVEAVADRKAQQLVIRNIWYEDGVRQTKKLQAALTSCLRRFARFNECDDIAAEASVGLNF